jgi:hypothetical protein
MPSVAHHAFSEQSPAARLRLHFFRHIPIFLEVPSAVHLHSQLALVAHGAQHADPPTLFQRHGLIRGHAIARSIGQHIHDAQPRPEHHALQSDIRSLYTTTTTTTLARLGARQTATIEGYTRGDLAFKKHGRPTIAAMEQSAGQLYNQCLTTRATEAPETSRGVADGK